MSSNNAASAPLRKPILTVLPSPTGQKEVFRQTRFANDAGALEIRIGGRSAALKNWSRTGIAFEATGPEAISLFRENISLEGVEVFCGDIRLYTGTVVVKSVRKLEHAVFVGAAFTENLFFVEGVSSALTIQACTAEVASAAAELEATNPEFSKLLLKMRAALRRIERTCREEEERWKKLSYDQRNEAERIFLPAMSESMRRILVDFDMRIAKIVDVEALPENSVYHSMVHEEIYPFFERADLARRAYEKPRGYAGDYEMMNQIYRSAYEGQDLFGRILHNYITNEHSGESVKFRKPYLNGYLTRQLDQPGFRKVLAVASGPAVEYQECVASWKAEDLSRLAITLFDLDREALEHAQTKILEIAARRGVEPSVSYVNASVKAFLGSSSEQKFDLIYSAGLFDYLDNPTSAALTRKFADMLNPGGTLVIGNFTKDNLTKAFLHLIAKWTLIHKTPEEILGWAKGLPDCTTRIEMDRNNMIGFLVLEKK